MDRGGSIPRPTDIQEFDSGAIKYNSIKELLRGVAETACAGGFPWVLGVLGRRVPEVCVFSPMPEPLIPEPAGILSSFLLALIRSVLCRSSIHQDDLELPNSLEINFY